MGFPSNRPISIRIAISVALIEILVGAVAGNLVAFIGILPLTVYHEFDSREGMYTTLLMSTGLTFGAISALFGLTNRIIDQGQYCTKMVSAEVQPDLGRRRTGEAVAGEEP